MSKKSKIFYYVVLLVNIAVFILDLSPINFPFFKISFGVTLVLIGIMLLIRAFSLKIDSSMFFGISLFGFGVINMVQYFGRNMFGVKQLWPYYLFVLSVASLATGLYFKDKLQFKLFVLFLGLGLIALLFVQNLINIWLMIGLMVAYFIAYFVINIIIFKKRRK